MQARSRGPLRRVLQVLDEEPVLPAELLGVVLRAARDALCPPGVALAAAVPPGTAPRPGTRVTLLPAGLRALERGELRGTLAKVMWALGKRPRSESELRARFPYAVPALAHLERLGFVSRTASTEPPRVRVQTERTYRLAPGLDLEQAKLDLARAPKRLELLLALSHTPAPARSSPALKALVESGLVVCEEREVTRGTRVEPFTADSGAPELTTHQRAAVGEI